MLARLTSIILIISIPHVAIAATRVEVLYANQLVEVLRHGGQNWRFLHTEIRQDKESRFLRPDDVLRVAPRSAVRFQDEAGTIWWVGPPHEGTVAELMRTTEPESDPDTGTIGPPRASRSLPSSPTLQIRPAQLQQLNEPQRISDDLRSFVETTVKREMNESPIASNYNPILWQARTLFEALWALDIQERKVDTVEDYQPPQATYQSRTGTELDIALLYMTMLQVQGISAEIRVGESHALIVLIGTEQESRNLFSANPRYTLEIRSTVYLPVRISRTHIHWVSGWYEGSKYANPLRSSNQAIE